MTRLNGETMIKNKNIVDVYWAPYGGNGFNAERKNTNRNIANMLWFEPQPVLKHIVEDRNKNVLFLKCPSITSLYKNTFVVRCPFDLTVTVASDPEGKKFIHVTNPDSNFTEDFIVDRKEDENSVFKMMSLSISYLFYAKESVELEVYPPVLSNHHSETLRNISVICGKFDISKWIRPTDYAFEIIDDFKPLTFKRGDPLFYIKFNTDKHVNLIRTPIDPEVENLIQSEVLLKNQFPGNSLKKNYEFAKPLLSLYNKFLFKKTHKCPFNIK